MTSFFYSLYNRIFALFAAILMIISPSFKAVMDRLDTDRQYQLNHIEELKESYENGTRTPCDEASFFCGDFNAMLKSGTRLNEITVIGTHNSYQRYAPAEKVAFSCDGNEEGKPITLADQLDAGIRSLEIDIETVNDESGMHFVCIHSPVFDMSSTCLSFEKALEELAVWSDNNPNHIPVSVLIEPKKVFIPLENMEYFSIESAKALDKTVRDTLGDRLLTPADALGSYDSFKQMRESNGWMSVKDALGKIMVILHPCIATADYVALDPTIKTQSMFPMVRTADKDESYASFLLLNKANKLLNQSEELGAGNYIIRTRVDNAGRFSAENLNDAASSAANIISTDHPYFGNGSSENKVCFKDNTMIKTTF